MPVLNLLILVVIIIRFWAVLSNGQLYETEQDGGFSFLAANAATEVLLTPILKSHESTFTCSSFIRIKQN
ncbi:hypothetical protein PL8927_110052 [Planktothrix serta PCC 8927]|uniref:Uncharacterized protein n=1 Tax=Planktothrix serta PCC 8927 TaxID=671068 RepID=A0A7Z9BEH7_9CYAN|nr:hypothetical protein PL8927_110052 [Planktothrix serta PCC 8927]